MPVKLYGPHDSHSTARVMATLYEKKVEFDLVEIDLKKGEQKDPDYLKIQPFGKVPALTDDDTTIFESRAIARMIAHKYEGQGTPLFGKTPEDKAVVEQWLEVESQNLNGPLSVVVSQLKKFGPKSIDESKISGELKKLNALLDVYQDHLDKNVYLAGDFFSLADLSHLPHLHYIIKICDRGDLLQIEYRPAVYDWWETCAKRRSWTRYAAILRLGY